MKLFLRIVLLLFISATGRTGGKSNQLLEIKRRLVKQPEVHGSFKQIRSVKDLDLQLKSSGLFRFKLPLNLSWNQKMPFVQDILMTPEKIVQTQADGTRQVITKDEQPVIFTFSSSFLGIFSGDEMSISQNFEYDVQMVGKSWKLSLKPKDAILQKVISSIKISGAEFVDQIEILEKSGNSNSIQFSGVKGN